MISQHSVEAAGSSQTTLVALIDFFFSMFSRKYSANQKIGSFHYVHKTPFGNYSFVCADATLTPGPKRPYNFFGILNQVQLQCTICWI